MTRDDIIRMAREAFDVAVDCRGRNTFSGDEYCLERFAALVAAAEREACAQVCENGHFLHDEAPDARFGKACAAAIRARGE